MTHADQARIHATRDRAGRTPPITGIAPVAVQPPNRRRLLVVRTAVITGTLAAMSVAAGPVDHRAGLDPATSRETIGEDVAALPLPSLEFLEREDAQRRAAATPPASVEAELGTFAEVEGVDLTVPSAATAMVGFHESLNPAALHMTPHGALEADHTGKEIPAPVDAPEAEGEATSVVLPTRQRPAGATSAVDIAVPEGEAIVAPVDGVVESVSPYFLYGQHPDVRIDVIPEGRPDLRVVIIHVSDVAVGAGDRLVAGETPLAASATPFPFASQIDRFVIEQDGEATPHVHVEINRVG